LRLIAEQAQMLTLASGAAIALRQGDLMLCRARAGATAPVLGAQLDTQSGLSGECVRTGRTLVCEDTENDPRVNLDVCRYLGIRSIAVLPISLGHEVVGVFEAFSAQARGFSGNEVAALESMRDLVLSVIRPSPQAEAPAASALAARAAVQKPSVRATEATVPPLRPPAPFRPAMAPDPEDDLLCEIEQRLQPEPPSDVRTRAFQLREAENTPPRPAPFANPDPEDDLLCEIEMRPLRTAPLAEPDHPHAMSGFAPAPLHLREPLISRKLIVFAVVVVMAGLVWLRWCNHAPRAAKNATPSTTVEAASTSLPPSAPPATQTAPALLQPEQPQPAPAANQPEIAESEPAVDTDSAQKRRPSLRPLPPSQEVRQHPANAKPVPAAEFDRPDHAGIKNEVALSSPPPSPAATNSSSRPAPASIPSQAEAPPVSSLSHISPPAFTLQPAPAVATPSAPSGQLSISHAVVSAAPEAEPAQVLSPDAFRLLLDSATAGDAGAQLALAVRYANGEGVRRSYPDALKWFKKARAQGVAPSPGKVAEAWGKVEQWARSHSDKK
jgi:hypothetical protein